MEGKSKATLDKILMTYAEIRLNYLLIHWRATINAFPRHGTQIDLCSLALPAQIFEQNNIKVNLAHSQTKQAPIFASKLPPMLQ